MAPAFVASYIALWILVLVVSVFVILILRQFGLQMLGTVEGVQRDGLPVGAKAPPLDVTNPAGEVVQWPGPAETALLVFGSPTCTPCKQVLPLLGYVARQSPNIAVAMVTQDQEALALLSDLVESNESLSLLAPSNPNLADQFRVRVSPFAFVLDADRRVRAKGLCDGPRRLRTLLIEGGLPQVAALIQLPADETLQRALAAPHD